MTAQCESLVFLKLLRNSIEKSFENSYIYTKKELLKNTYFLLQQRGSQKQSKQLNKKYQQKKTHFKLKGRTCHCKKKFQVLVKKIHFNGFNEILKLPKVKPFCSLNTIALWYMGLHVKLFSHIIISRTISRSLKYCNYKQTRQL